MKRLFDFLQRLNKIIAFLGLLLFFCLLLALAGRFTYLQGLGELADEGKFRLELYVAYLQGVLEKYEGLPELLATNKRLVNFLKNPGGRERIEALNRYLATINSISDAADTYLMDSEGLTIAASNWQAERPFVGRNFSYRPYFQQAMQGHLGRYFALGTTSSRRGYYFAYPVRSKQTILGAVVIKINIDSVEHNWGHRNETFLVTDPDGVIFITTNPGWRFHVLFSLTPEVKKRVEQSKRYPHAALTPLTVVSTTEVATGAVISLQVEGVGRSYLQQSVAMPQAGWQVHILSDTHGVQVQVLRTLMALGSGFVLLALLLLMTWQRQQRLSERRRHEEDTRTMLEEANANLEQRVNDRTTALTEANKLLRAEIEDRKQTEEKLRHTRNELIHTAKLAAIGQMSAGINHELNQPLAAIRAYADNGRQFLHKGRLEDVSWNLEQISELTDRMAGIGAQLKVFSRKSGGRMSRLPLHGIIDGALEILVPLVRKSDVEIHVMIVPEDIEVVANSVHLQQALVNLIGNAIQAVQGQEEKLISVSASYQDQYVRIAVVDNGPGLKENSIEKIFEPFYTTKSAGLGLGLGLTITRRIIEELGGVIKLLPVEHGACFVLLLQRGDRAHFEEQEDNGAL